MLNKLFKYRVFILLSSTFFLCQCTKVVNSTEPVVAVKKKVTSPYTLPTAEYLALAEKQIGEQKQSLLISAAGRLIAEGQWRQGFTILTQTAGLTETQADEKNVLLAKIDLLRDKPRSALTKLATLGGSEALSPYFQIEFHESLAQAYRAEKKATESILERIKLESLITDTVTQKSNLRILWLTLINLSLAELQTLAAESSKQSELHGWAQLALLSRQFRTNSKSLLAALDQWQTYYNKHPANAILPVPIDSIADKLVLKPKKIALLLPLSGTFSGPGNAIREGFMAAHSANQNNDSPAIALFDTDKGLIEDIYQRALEEGSDYVVGPLTKSQVATIAARQHPVPTLLLNDSDIKIEDNSYFFGLSPAHEAKQVAIKAKSKGYRRALIIAPRSDWGTEIAKAFTQQWNENGGLVVDSLNYGVNEDLNKKMQELLHITDSQIRDKQLKQVLGYNFQSLSSRRQDFDMIFLLAYPSKARQIMPLLKYYYAGDVPVYATSSVYSGNANALKDKDLDGVIFCDIPWVFSHQMGARNWPEQFNSYNRLYALGMDSYALATQLNSLILFPADGSRDTNGTLYLNSNQQVARVLEWGQFEQGLAHSLGETV
jgi:outer membrane PBP1 activator LpoA protein